jgi:hypothetical protein
VVGSGKNAPRTPLLPDTIKDVGFVLVFGAIGLGAMGFMAPFVIFGWIYFSLAYILPEH